VSEAVSVRSAGGADSVTSTIKSGGSDIVGPLPTFAEGPPLLEVHVTDPFAVVTRESEHP